MAEVNIVCEVHKWLYSNDLRVRICEECDAWEHIEPPNTSEKK